MFYIRLVVCAIIAFDALFYYEFFDFSEPDLERPFYDFVHYSGPDMERPFLAKRFQRNLNGKIEHHSTFAQLPAKDELFRFERQLRDQAGQNFWLSDRLRNAVILTNARLFEMADPRLLSTKISEEKAGKTPFI